MDEKGVSMKETRLQGIFTSIKLDEIPLTDEIFHVELLRAGSFLHPMGDNGRVNFTPENLKKFKENFDENTRKMKDNEIPVDYGHQWDDKASGWIKEVHLKEDDTQLWVDIDWTPKAHKAISEKEWRYISADLDFDYMDNESAISYGPTLFGAGLTNRPHIKNMEAIFNEKTQGENVSKEEMLKKIADLEAELSKMKASEEGKNKKLEEKNEEMEASKKELSELKVEIDTISKEAKFSEYLREGKIIPAQKDAFMKMDISLSEEFYKNAPKVNLSEEKGHSKDAKKVEEVLEFTTENVEDEVLRLAEIEVEKNNVDLSEALSNVLSFNEKLRKTYESKFNR